MQFKVKGILSYPHLHTPRAVQQGDDPKYSVSVLVPQNDPQVANIMQIIEQEKANGWPSGFPTNGKVFLRNSEQNPGYVEIRCNASASDKPAVVDMNMQPVIDPAAVYAGCVAWVAMNSFTYNQPVNKGVSAGLNAVMLTGEEGALGRLDNRPSVESMFADVAGGATPAPAPMVGGPDTTFPAAPAPAAPQYVMTEKANGYTREQLLAQNWTDEMLIQQGLMLPPGGVMPSFTGG